MGNNLQPIITQINGHTWRQKLCVTQPIKDVIAHGGNYCIRSENTSWCVVRTQHLPWLQYDCTDLETTGNRRRCSWTLQSDWAPFLSQKDTNSMCAKKNTVFPYEVTSVHTGSALWSSQKDRREEQVLESTYILGAQSDEFTFHYTTVASPHCLQIETAHIIRYT